MLTRWAIASGVHGLILDDGAFELETRMREQASRGVSRYVYREHWAGRPCQSFRHYHDLRALRLVFSRISCDSSSCLPL